MREEKSDGVHDVNPRLNVSQSISGARYCNFPMRDDQLRDILLWYKHHLMKFPCTLQSFIAIPLLYSFFFFFVCLPLTVVFRSTQLRQLLALKPKSSGLAPLRTRFPVFKMDMMISSCFRKFLREFKGIMCVMDLAQCLPYVKHSVNIRY